jgi:hypothetical protein
MSFATLTGIDVLAGRVTVPYSGAWHADLVLCTPIDVPGPQTLLLGTVAWTCAYVRDIAFAGRRGVRVVGGLGGWRTTIPAKQYGGGFIPTQAVLADAAAACGELPPVVSPTLPPTLGAGWCRGQDVAGATLQRVAGDAWWVDPVSGVVQTGPRVPTSIVSPFVLLDLDGATGVISIATDFPGDWAPGATFLAPTYGGTVSRAMHTIHPDTMRTEVMLDV